MFHNRYAEKANYNYSTGQGKGAIGHFTQIVWKNSKNVGVGIATSGAKTWVVAKYTPSGNYVNQYTTNVGCRKSGCKRVIFAYQYHKTFYMNFKCSKPSRFNTFFDI